ncbi:3'-5' exonuclease [Comamonadaceae bacterium G21597-S1]|nr:3'-5' exonuclease [Comamonadaceae bacterium G21597-S1]
MPKAIFFDTETSGLPLFSEPSEDPRQPHIVQLAAIVVDLDTREHLASMNTIIRPEGWTIPKEVSDIHGITTERAMAEGIPEEDALDMFLSLWDQKLRVAHNESFDARIIRIAQSRFGYDETQLALWKGGKALCTQRMATPIMKIPPTPKMRAAGFFKHKSANLQEAHKHFTGKPFEDAHSAMADVKACIAVYFAITDLKRAAQPVAA